MNFWIIATALFVVSAAVMCWPLFAGSSRERITAVVVLLVMPLAGLMMYQYIGTPEAINIPTTAPQPTAQTQDPHSSDQPQMEDMLADLQQRMAENPDDPDGWLILGRSLKAMQRYEEAKTALANANRLVPGTPMIMVELAEATLFASGQSQISPEALHLLESAIEIDPQQQKGLWMLGMAAAQQGDDTRAIGIWQSLLAQLDPASGAAESVTQQIEMAQARLGDAAPVPVVEKVVTAEFGIPVTITISDELAGAIPGNAVMFVFIHPKGGAGGMPLAVKRLAPRGFPLSLNFTDADLIRPGTSLEDFEELDISARISMSGIVAMAPGDIQANLVTLNTKAITEIALHLDQRVP